MSVYSILKSFIPSLLDDNTLDGAVSSCRGLSVVARNQVIVALCSENRSIEFSYQLSLAHSTLNLIACFNNYKIYIEFNMYRKNNRYALMSKVSITTDRFNIARSA